MAKFLKPGTVPKKIHAHTLYSAICVLLLFECCHGWDHYYGNKNRMLSDNIHMLQGYQGYKNDLMGFAKVEQQGREDTVVPEYMRNLFSRYRNQDVPVGSSFANTVRSINAEIGVVYDESMFIFNLTSVESTEQHLHSDIHLYKKRRRQGINVKVILYEIAPTYVTQLDTYDITHSDVGWFTFPVSAAVKSCLSVRRNLPHILALRFVKVNSRGKDRPLHLKGFIRHLSRPFLVVYSNSSLNITYDHITARLPTKTDLPNTFINPESGKQELFYDPPRNKKKLDRKNGDTPIRASVDTPSELPVSSTQEIPVKSDGVPEDETNNDTKNSTDNQLQVKDENTTKINQVQTVTQTPEMDSTSPKSFNKKDYLDKKRILERKHNSIHERFARSVEDNRLPENSVKVLTPTDTQLDTSSQLVQTNSQLEPNEQLVLPNTGEKVDLTNNAPEFDIFSEEYLRSQYFKNHDSSLSDNKGSKKKRRRKLSSARASSQNGNVLPLPHEWDFELPPQTNIFDVDSYSHLSNVDTPAPFSRRGRKCGVKKMILDFIDIGWSEWILEPKAFASNYCAGTCSFPDPRDRGLSNHASLSGLIHSIGIHKEMPAPCCVPETMASTSLLYVDHNNNIVYKNYRNMAVQSCACV